MNEKKGKNFLRDIPRKYWNLIWKDESLFGWIVSIISIMILIKFIIFPLLTLLTGTALPVAIVESCSMYHDKDILDFNDFERWWDSHEMNYEKFDITHSDFEDFKMKNGFNKGDILFITGTMSKNIKVGDIIIFEGGTQHPIIHRVVKIRESKEKRKFTTMGDNVGRIQFFEEEINEEQIVGKARTKVVPYLGWVKLIFYEPFREENGKGLCKEK